LQVSLVTNIMRSVNNGRSCCHQMIMGAGKTTVVGPLLCLMLADGKQLVTQVCCGLLRGKVAWVLFLLFSFDGKSLVNRKWEQKKLVTCLSFRLCPRRSCNSNLPAASSQVVPAALLEFSRSVLREKFSAVVRKSVYTFEYDRFQKTNNYALYRKLLKARDAKGIIIATDTSVKAFELKFIEVLHQLDRLQTAGLCALVLHPPPTLYFRLCLHQLLL
jgi:hypothetical protein